jgi:hypothetical protein
MCSEALAATTAAIGGGTMQLRAGRNVRAAIAVGLTIGSLGAITSIASSSVGASRVVTRDGFKCTKVGNGVHHRLVGRAGQVVCALGGNDTLIAVGPGRVVLIAGSGRDTLIASSNRHSHDILIGGTARDRFQGGAGWDNLQGGSAANQFLAGRGTDQLLSGGTASNSYDCSSGSGGTVTVVEDQNAQGSQDDDCQGEDVQTATQEWTGTVTSTDGKTTMTITWSDANDAAQSWLSSNANPKSVTFDISSAIIERDGGGPVQVGDGVEVSSNPPTTGTTLVAVAVQAGSGDDNNQGDDNQGDNCQGNADDQGNAAAPAGASGPSGPTGASGSCGPTGPTGSGGDE